MDTSVNNVDTDRQMKLDGHLKLLVQVEFGSQSLCIKYFIFKHLIFHLK